MAGMMFLRLASTTALITAGALTLSCNSTPSARTLAPDLKPAVSIKELMENIIDPIADNVFDAVGTDISARGIVETRPTTEEHWIKVRVGAVTLAEGTNLLKIPRPVAPPGDRNNSGGPNAPELSPAAIQKKIDADRTLWNRHADELREVALEVLATVKTKNADALFAM